MCSMMDVQLGDLICTVLTSTHILIALLCLSSIFYAAHFVLCAGNSVTRVQTEVVFEFKASFVQILSTLVRSN